MRYLFAALAMLAASPAYAHHVIDGAMPRNAMEGFLSGLAHPVIGLDHFAFIIAAGMLAGLIGRPFLAPLGLVAGAVLGAVYHLGAGALPGAEILIALSLLVAGVAVFLARSTGVGALIGAFALAGLFHGYAYGESIVGAEGGVIATYLIGFTAIQWGVAALAGYGAKILNGSRAFERVRQITGAAFAAAGAMFLIQAI